MTKTETKTDERVAAGLFVSYYTDVTGPDGVVRNTLLTAARGETIQLSEAEQARLDALGMLEEPGGDAEGDRAEALTRYRAARGDKDAAEIVLGRALNPADNVQPSAGPGAVSVSPPGGGAAPAGTLLTGDTGAPDVQPVGGQVPDATGGIVRLDAPDVRTAAVGDLAQWITDEKATVDETVALAEGDKALAEKVLEAESIATGGDGRKGVVSKLSAITEAE